VTIAAIATAFHPDQRLDAVVAAASATCSEVVVIDNTPAEDPSRADTLTALPGVTVVRSGRNAGLAGALNEGVRRLPPEVHAVLLLDQDSVLPADMVAGLAARLADPQVGIVAPTPWDATHHRAFDAAPPSGAASPADRDAVITSGMLVRRQVLDDVGEFREEFFVDHVDSDFCLRARRAGWRIVQDPALRLPHSLGEVRQRQVLGRTVHTSQHPVWRVYWYARNATILLREHRATAPGWVAQTRRYLPIWLAARGLLETPRAARLQAALRGFADGRRGRVSDRYLPPGAAHPAFPVAPKGGRT
jgi:rhamnosyltransferase